MLNHVNDSQGMCYTHINSPNVVINAEGLKMVPTEKTYALGNMRSISIRLRRMHTEYLYIIPENKRWKLN